LTKNNLPCKKVIVDQPKHKFYVTHADKPVAYFLRKGSVDEILNRLARSIIWRNQFMKSIKQLTLALITLGFMATTGASYAADAHPETPASAPAGVKLVDAKQVQELQAKGAIIVDTRKASEYGEGSIKGAINVPYDPEKSAKSADFDASQDHFDMSKLGDKNATIVVYCNSGTCFKSYKASVVLSKNGYKNIYWYRDGFPDWKARKLPME
jgi:rhodanese-related sulfurtransferase